jgi:hypothetical protein
MPKRFDWTRPAIAAACVVALLLGVGLGLLLFRGPEQPAQTSEATPVCAGEPPLAVLEGSEVPTSGPKLEAALMKAVGLYFACQSLPAERFARTFATLSVVIAQYASDPECSTDDRRRLSTQWSNQKSWADQQARADLLMTQLRQTIASTLACLPDKQQRLFYTDMARAFAFAAGGHAMQTFVNPTFGGERVDRCLNYARDCNEPAARAWCQRFGYSRIAKWEWVNTQHTVTLGDRKSCTGTCGAFTTIVCAE